MARHRSFGTSIWGSVLFCADMELLTPLTGIALALIIAAVALALRGKGY